MGLAPLGLLLFKSALTMFNSQIAVLNKNEIQLHLLLLLQSAYFSGVGGTLMGSIWEQNRNLTPRNRLIRTGGPPGSSFMRACLGLVNTGPAGSEVAKWFPGQKLLEVLAGAS